MARNKCETKIYKLSLSNDSYSKNCLFPQYSSISQISYINICSIDSLQLIMDTLFNFT